MHRRGHRLLVVAFVERGPELRLGFGRLHEHEARRAGVGGGRAELQQVVEPVQGVVADLAAEARCRCGPAEQLVECGWLDRCDGRRRETRRRSSGNPVWGGSWRCRDTAALRRRAQCRVSRDAQQPALPERIGRKHGTTRPRAACIRCRLGAERRPCRQRAPGRRAGVGACRRSARRADRIATIAGCPRVRAASLSVAGAAIRSRGRGPRRISLRSKIRATWSGRPASRLSRMTCSKNTRPETGRSSTWVRENSACQTEIS